MIEEIVSKILKSDELIEKKETATNKELDKREKLISRLPNDIKNLLIEVDKKYYLVNNHFKRGDRAEFSGIKFSITPVETNYNE